MVGVSFVLKNNLITCIFNGFDSYMINVFTLYYTYMYGMSWSVWVAAFQFRIETFKHGIALIK